MTSSDDLLLGEPTRVPCPDCGGVGKLISTVPGVPASVCTKFVTCDRCWPRDEGGAKKFWNDGTAGTIDPRDRERDEAELNGTLDDGQGMP